MKPPTKHRVTFLSVRSFARLTAAPALRGVCPGAFPAVRCRYLSAPPDGTALPTPPRSPSRTPPRVRPPGSPRTSKRSGMGHLRTWGGGWGLRGGAGRDPQPHGAPLSAGRGVRSSRRGSAQFVLTPTAQRRAVMGAERHSFKSPRNRPRMCSAVSVFIHFFP